MLKSISPGLKRRVKQKLQREELAKLKGSNLNIRKAVGLNLSNNLNKNVDAESPLRKEICLSFDRDDVSRISPVVKKLVPNPENQMENVPAHLRLSTLNVLHAKIEAESGTACSYQKNLSKYPLLCNQT